jgi:hypothetical protein
MVASPSLPSRRSLAILLAALAAVPLAGCLSGSPPGRLPLLQASGLFPFEERQPGDPGVEAIGSCAELEGILRQRALDQARVLLDQSLQQHGHWGRSGLDFAMGGAPEAMVASSADSAGGSGHSSQGAQATGTNNQEAAADEGDLVKTDGEWAYVLSAGILHVLRSRTVGGLEEVGNLTLSTTWGSGQLLLERRSPDPRDDRLVAILGGQPAETQAFLDEATRQRVGPGMTRVVVLSLADRGAPAVEHESWVEGHLAGARLVGGTAYAVVQRGEPMFGLRTWVGPEESDLLRLGYTYREYASLGEARQKEVREQAALLIDRDNQRLLDGLSLEDELPVVLHQRFGFILPEPTTEDSCRDVLAMPDATGRAFTTILAIGVADAALPASTTQVLGGSAIVYADTGALVLAAPTLDGWWSWAQPGIAETTDLLWFDLDGLRVTQRAAGRVPGMVLNSFALDVHGDALRVATTTGAWNRGWGLPEVAMSSQLLVLDAAGGALVPRGQVGGIAPGERLWSVRFTDDRAYLVTFQQVDPLWVVDLRSAVPRILGELHVPGVSTYIHPLGDEQLLTIGYGGGEGGLGLDWSRIVISLFDVSDPGSPSLLDTLDVAPRDGWSSSGALHEHKAFTYWEAVGTLAVPVTSWSEGYTASGEPVSRQRLALELVDVDRADGRLSRRGAVDQDALSQGRAWGSEIERSWFLGFPQAGPVSVYALSAFGVTSHDLATLADQASVAFPPPYGQHGGCCWID